jgi:hypothetical protein
LCERFVFGESKAALADWNQSKKLDPISFAGWTNRGSSRLHTRDLDGALADLAKAIDLTVQAQKSAAIALSFGQTNENSSWLADFQKAIELNPP